MGYVFEKLGLYQIERGRETMIKFLQALRNMRKDEDGAVTVDWVVLTAAVVSFGMLVGAVIWGQTGGLSKTIADYLGTTEVATTFAAGESL